MDASLVTGPNPDLRRRRRSSAAVPEAFVRAAKDIGSKVEDTLLVLWDDLPAWRRDNHFILSGYRQGSNSYWKSFLSLFYIHNETVNIWSHALGALAFPALGLWLYHAIAPRYASASHADIIVFSSFFCGALLCLGMSATYHTLNHHSEEVARWGNKLDYSGIVCLIVGSFVPTLYYAFFCTPGLMTTYVGGIFLLGLGCGVVSWVDKFRSPAWRPYRAAMFVGLGASGVVPVCHGLMLYGYKALQERMGLDWVLLEGLLYIFGALLYAARWPERNWPGAFDIWGSSHQLFHILILFAASSQLIGMTKAFDFHHNVLRSECPST